MEKEEKLKADLEHNYYMFEYFKDKSRLELIDLLRGRDERIDKDRIDDVCGDKATIEVFVGDELKQSLTYGGEGDEYMEYYRSTVFDIAQSQQSMYEAEENLKVKVTFEL
tara:strand:- start:1513 stop:1842 length:330 start_codon:yes stop_codon:yes gene_type:complete